MTREEAIQFGFKYACITDEEEGFETYAKIIDNTVAIMQFHKHRPDNHVKMLFLTKENLETLSKMLK